MENHLLINQDSGKQDWMTPSPIYEAARFAMGGIDLDPASSAKANQRIEAADYFTVDDDGLSLPWWGRVWLNWPYSAANNKLWSAKLLAEYEAGRITQACAICFACTSEHWFQPLFDFPIAFLTPRTHYLDPESLKGKSGPTKGSAVVYLGPNALGFAQAFKMFGTVVTRI